MSIIKITNKIHLTFSEEQKKQKIKNKHELKIGQWYSRCCHEDLYEIKTQEDIDDIIDDWDEFGIQFCNVFKNRIDALFYIRNVWTIDNYKKEIEECNELLEKEYEKFRK